ncbi:MAG: hypothetical protein WC640_01005 [Candidatus Paceibacterota bacterium]|jgi:uncharacterized membrane protein YjdF
MDNGERESASYSQRRSRLGIVFAVLLPVYIFLMLSGDIWSHFMSNDLCYRYLGCNSDFFGYDGLVHFLSGVIIALAVVLTERRYLERTININKQWLRALMIMGIAALIGIVWEILEFSYDHFKMDFLHFNLIHPNILAQPNNTDTVGDLTLGLLGALATICLLNLYYWLKYWRYLPRRVN